MSGSKNEKMKKRQSVRDEILSVPFDQNDVQMVYHALEALIPPIELSEAARAKLEVVAWMLADATMTAIESGLGKSAGKDREEEVRSAMEELVMEKAGAKIDHWIGRRVPSPAFLS